MVSGKIWLPVSRQSAATGLLEEIGEIQIRPWTLDAERGTVALYVPGIDYALLVDAEGLERSAGAAKILAERDAK